MSLLISATVAYFLSSQYCNGESNGKMNYKTCTKCGLKLEATNENFAKQKNGLYGLYASCKKCMKKWRDERKDIKKEYDKIYNKENSEWIKERSKNYYYSNHDIIKEKNREKSATLEHKIKRKKYLATRKDRDRELSRLWAENNRERLRELKKNRYHREKSVKQGFTIEDWEKCKEYFCNCCAYCGIYDENLTQDHFIPVSKDGGYVLENMIPACRSCNSSKWNTDFVDWYFWQPFYSASREEKILNYLGYNQIKL